MGGALLDSPLLIIEKLQQLMVTDVNNTTSVYLREGFRKTPNILDERNGYP